MHEFLTHFLIAAVFGSLGALVGVMAMSMTAKGIIQDKEREIARLKQNDAPKGFRGMVG